MTKKKLKQVLKVFTLTILIFIYLVCILNIEIQNDTFFDIKVGQEYLTQGITKVDQYSIHDGLKYVSHHFMVNIITFLTYDILGINGMTILLFLLSMILALLLYKANTLFLKSKKLSYAMVFLQLFLLKNFLSVRAQMYSYIIIVLEIIFLELFLRNGKKRYLAYLSILPFLLINFHAGSIPFFFIIMAVYLLNIIRINISKFDYVKEYTSRVKYLLIPIALGLLLIFINPFGVDAITYAFKTVSNSFITQNIAEFLPFSLTSGNNVIIAGYAFVIILALLLTNKKIKLYHILLMFGTLFMTLLAIRNFSLFVLVTITCLPYIEDIFVRAKAMTCEGLIPSGVKFVNYTTYISFALVVVVLSGNCLVNKNFAVVSDKTYPVHAVKYIKENIGSDKRIFNEYFYGTLLLFNDIDVFIDSRCDLYTKDYNPNINIAFDYISIINCSGNYLKLLKEYDIEYIFINKKTSLATNISDNDDFEKIYEDNISCIFEVKK